MGTDIASTSVDHNNAHLFDIQSTLIIDAVNCHSHGNY